METVADGLLIAGAVAVAFYCFVLSRRLSRFTDLDRGVGGAVAVLSVQVEDLKRAVDGARAAAESSGQSLEDLTAQAERVARKLELHMASLQDIPDSQTAPVSCPDRQTRPSDSAGTPPTQTFFSRRVAESVS